MTPNPVGSVVIFYRNYMIQIEAFKEGGRYNFSFFFLVLILLKHFLYMYPLAIAFKRVFLCAYDTHVYMSKSSRNSFTTVSCTLSSYRLDREWYTQVCFAEVERCSSEEAARQVAGRDSGFCIRMTHRATHRLLCLPGFFLPCN
jgi:hypothetical protein